MRISKLFGKTLREEPAEAELASHRFMLKSGMISQVASGVYGYLPLAWRALRKIEQIIREEMDCAGGQEVRLSALHPRYLWELSGRAEAFGDDLFTLSDRRDRPLVLAPTHEELLTDAVKANVFSYRDLPLVIYQIQTKFRDEPRPRGGLLRVREFDMKDAYSFDIDNEGLDQNFGNMVKAYKNIFARCDLSPMIVEADSGAIGGKESYEFILQVDSGEDTVLSCATCGYTANAERAVFAKSKTPCEDLLPLEEIHTPGIKTIEALASFLGVSTSKTLKSVFYIADGDFLVVTIRGDLDVNEVKLRNAIHASELRLAGPSDVREAGVVAGSASAVGLLGIKTIADDSVRLGSNLIAGANKPDYHYRGANYPRDFQADLVSDIALAKEGYICLSCSSQLETRRGIELGHVFKIGTQYSEAMDLRILNQNGELSPVIMGCYGIGVGRLLAAIIEQHHDDNGIVFPVSIAPYDVALIALNVENPRVSEEAESLYSELCDAGVQVLYDDRPESAGVKFNDADLIGLPVRVVMSARNLREGAVEIKRRSEAEAITVARDQAVPSVKELLST